MKHLKMLIDAVSRSTSSLQTTYCLSLDVNDQALKAVRGLTNQRSRAETSHSW